MKIIQYIGLFLLASSLYAIAPNQEFVKNYKESYSISDIENLQVSNKYGDVNILTLNTNPDQLEIDVEVKVQASSSEDASEVFERIRISIEKHGSLVRAATNIEPHSRSWWKFWESSNGEYEINYIIRVPKAVSMQLENKYGNIYCEPYKGSANINLKYGEIYTQNFDASLNLELKYGKGKMGSCRDINLNIGYGELKVERAADVVCDSKYSKIKIQHVKDFNIQSKYDKFHIGEADYVTSNASYTELDFEKVNSLISNSAYSDVEVAFLGIKGDFNHKYGDVHIDMLGKNFEKLDASLSYCSIDLDILNAAVQRIDAEARYGDIRYPEGYYRKDSIEEDNTKSVTLEFAESGGIIQIEANYGNIRIKR